MKRRNVLTLVLALVLVAALAVGGTLAYFTDQDATGTNAFTMGHVDIGLDEYDPEDKEWTDDGLTYDDVTPGATVDKKARVTVNQGSEKCYVMVTVEVATPADTKLNAENINDLYAAVEAAVDASTTPWTHTRVTKDGKTLIQCVYNGDSTPGDGAADRIVNAKDAKQELFLFEQITIPASFGNNTADQSFDIVLNSYAIQSDNLEYSNEIWNNTFETYTAETPAPAPAPETPAEP